MAPLIAIDIEQILCFLFRLGVSEGRKVIIENEKEMDTIYDVCAGKSCMLAVSLK